MTQTHDDRSQTRHRTSSMYEMPHYMRGKTDRQAARQTILHIGE